MLSNRKTPWLALAAISFFTAYGLWQIAIREPEPSQTRLIDLPQATPAALLNSGIDRQTLSEYLELKTSAPMGSTSSTTSTLSAPVLALATQKEVTPAPGRTKPPMAGRSSQQIVAREKRDGHSRVNTLTKESNEENLSVSQAQRAEPQHDQSNSDGVFRPARPDRAKRSRESRAVGSTDQPRNVGNVGDQVSRLQRSRVGRRAVSKGEQVSPDFGQWVKVEISTYSRSYHGNGTHSGERYDHHNGHTAATTYRKGWVLPKGSTWEVEYLGKTITVRVNDTGSTKPRMAPYWLDLSGRAYADLTNGAAPSRFKARMRRVK